MADTEHQIPKGAANAPAPGASYGDFFVRFGGSYRVDFTRLGFPHGVGSWLGRSNRRHRAKHAVRRALTTAGLSAVDGQAYLRSTNRREFRLPWTSGIPKEFIRLDPWEGEYLFTLASRAGSGVLETGRFHGGSTFLFACANERTPIASIDIAPQDDGRLLALFDRHGVGANVELIVGDSRSSHRQIGDLDLLFVDGDHSYEGCLGDLRAWYASVVPNGHIVVHDCYFGSEVREAAIDFAAEFEVESVAGPYLPATHWHQPAGSLAHFVKRG